MLAVLSCYLAYFLKSWLQHWQVLLGAIATNISVAMKNDSQRDAALITFLATASGMHFLGLSSVFWGICIV